MMMSKKQSKIEVMNIEFFLPLDTRNTIKA